MKRLIPILAMFLMFASCDDLLNVEPKSIVTTANMWQDQGDAQGAMNGMYRQFRQTMNQTFFWGEARTGLYTHGVSLGDTELFQNRVNPGSEGADWTHPYRTINDANLILKYVPKIDFTSDVQKNNIMANAYFVRAYCYYMIVRLWGDAPLLLDGFESAKQEGLFPSRAPATRIYEQIEGDLYRALDLVPANASDRFFATPSGIRMLMADYHLWMAKTRNGGQDHLIAARNAVDAVLQDSYQLVGDYEQVFRNDANPEIIFSIMFERDSGPGNFMAPLFLLPIQNVPPHLRYNPIPFGGNTQRYAMTEEAEAFLYEKEYDSRAMVNFAVYEFDNIVYRFVAKYLGEFTDGTFFSTSDLKLYRLGEALMFKAEIENELGNQTVALGYINQIAERAYGQADYYTGAFSKEELDEIILEERMKEFPCEGKTWFDLIRFDKSFEKIWSLQGRENEEGVLLWPLSFESLNRNRNLTQNPGYQ